MFFKHCSVFFLPNRTLDCMDKRKSLVLRRERDRDTERQTDIETDRQTGTERRTRETDRQTDRIY